MRLLPLLTTAGALLLAVTSAHAAGLATRDPGPKES